VWQEAFAALGWSFRAAAVSSFRRGTATRVELLLRHKAISFNNAIRY
jgi:hypothetical protein